jgi:hypothetical protein
MIHIYKTGQAFVIVGLMSCVAAATLDYSQALANDRDRTVTKPYVMREDFQGDNLGQWASYPPAQDIGYEPSLSPTADQGAHGGRALMRIMKPNRAGSLRFGFIKKTFMRLSHDGALVFLYRLNALDSSSALEIGLAGANGTLYANKIPAKVNGWLRAELALSEFLDASGRRPVAGLSVEAIYVVASISSADPDVTYRFMIDDVTLSAVRDARFDVRIPKTEVIEPWATLLADKAYRTGATFALEALAPTSLVHADCSLITQDERVITTEKLYDDGTHGDKRAGDGVWSNGAIYTLRSSDPTGVWRVRLRGATAEGTMVSTFVRMIVRPQKAAGHPRLFFGAADRQKLVERARNPKLLALWTHLQTTAKTARASGELVHGGDVFEMLDKEYLLPSLLAYFDVLNRARSRIAYNSFEAYVANSEEARLAAKAALLSVARWGRWEPPWFKAHGQHTYYPAGLLAADVAFGYDLLYDDLSSTERAVVRQALIEKSIIPTFKEYVVDNRLMANTSNWIAHTVGGALIAAASISDDLSEMESDGRFEIYVSGLLRKLEDHISASFLRDGSYGEGISYQEFDTETLAPALVAINRAFGIDYWKHSHVLDSLTYAIYTLAQPASASLDMGDTHPPAGHGIPALVYQSKDPVVRWYYSQFDRPSLSRFIFYDDSVEPQAPTLPTSRIFREKGNAVFRSGWGKDDLIFLYRAGPNFNHHHADQGSFLLTVNGENLVSEAGWSDYYKDPYYVTYFTQAVGHNTLLVDGNPESQSIADTLQFAALSSYPRISDALTSDFYDSVDSDLTPVYQGRLERFTRKVIFVKPHFFVIFDDVKARGAPARFDWLLHLPNRAAIEVTDDVALYRGKQAALAIRSFAPNPAKIQVHAGRVPYPDFAARTPAVAPPQPAYLDLSTGPVGSTSFLVALVPSRTGDGARTLVENMTEIRNKTWLGIRTNRGSERDLILFRNDNSEGDARHGEWSTDGSALMVTNSNEQLLTLSAHSTRSVLRSGRVFFSSNKPATFATHYERKEIRAIVSVSQATETRFSTGAVPVKVQIDGRDLLPTAFRYSPAEQTTQTVIPSGRHEIVFSLP